MAAYLVPKGAPDGTDQPEAGLASDPSIAFFNRKVADGACSQEVAEAVAAAFKSIERELAPVLGPRGVAALYRRSLHLAGKAHPTLPPGHAGTQSTLDLGTLVAALSRQTAAEAATTGAGLLLTFHGLLSSLIGPSLTERLLRPVWADFLSGTFAGNTSS